LPLINVSVCCLEYEQHLIVDGISEYIDHEMLVENVEQMEREYLGKVVIFSPLYKN